MSPFHTAEVAVNITSEQRGNFLAYRIQIDGFLFCTRQSICIASLLIEVWFNNSARNYSVLIFYHKYDNNIPSLEECIERVLFYHVDITTRRNKTF